MSAQKPSQPSNFPAAALSSHWSLDSSVSFLNHGSFGACPTVVLDEQSRWRQIMERQPVHFFLRQLEPQLDQSRASLAEFLNASPDQLAWVRNATSGVNAVLQSLRFGHDDELLTTDHAYNACRNALDFVAKRDGACVVVAKVPFPLTNEQQVVDAVLSNVSSRTRIALLDHVSSPTALIMPIGELVREFTARGIETLIDGAHAPGMLDLNLRELGATYYTGNCHKWICAPKGAAFLYVAPDRQHDMHPTVISHGANSLRRDRSRYIQEFDWVGTDDPTAVLCIPRALNFLNSLLPGGISALRDRNRTLALTARAALCTTLDVPIPAPESMIGSMASVPLPEARSRQDAATDAVIDPLQEKLWQDHRIEVPVFAWPEPPRRLIRISAQAYNQRSQFEMLADTMRSLLCQ